MNKLDKKQIIALSASTIVLVLSVGFYIYYKNHDPIPNSITSQLNFNPVVAGAQKTITKPSNIIFNQKSQILSYSQQFKGVNVQISQQSAPDSYIDFPEKLNELAKTMNLEQTIQTNKGEVFIIKKDGQQTGLTIQGRVLILVQADQPLSNEQWVELFSLFEAL